ncbi:MAG: hypothetical protein K2N24_07055 [Lachnospiraceae bacterium]|nr:hypothetical protein [Lachnospiraceae bacterium]
MTRKKKIVIIVVAVMLVMVVSATIWTIVIKNKKSKEEAENIEIVISDKEGLTDSVSEEQGADVRTEESSHTGIQTTTEEEKKPTAESGSTGEDNKSTGGTSNNNASQMTESTATQATTTRAPGTPEQPAGENPGSGNGNSHQHTWEAQYRTVHHDEEGHYEDVCVQKAYDEPVYETHYVCNYCGLDLGDYQLSHCLTCGPPMPEDNPFWEPGATLGSSYGTIRVQVGTTHHEAVYEQKWIVDKKAYDEQVLDGYKCTTCGVTK